MAYTFAGHFGPEAIIDGSGNKRANAQVEVFLTDGVTQATLYADRTKAATVANPTLANANGNLTFFADPGEYRLVVRYLGVVVATLDVTVPIDPTEAAQDTDVSAHLSDTAAAHAASAVSFTPTGTLASTNVQDAIAEAASEAAAVAEPIAAAHVVDASAAHVAAAVSFAPAGTIAATDVQSAIEEVSGDVTTLSTSPTSRLARTGVKTSAYVAVAGDLVPVNTTSGAVTITLPNAPADKSLVAVKHIIQGSTNAVTIACAGSDVFNKAGGSTTATLSLLNQAVLLVYAATGAIWTVVADDLPLSVLDSRFVSLLGGTTADPQRVKGVLKFATQDGVGGAEPLRVLDADSPAGPFMSLEFNNALATSPEAIHWTTGSAYAGSLGAGQNVLAIGNNYGGVAIFINNYLTGVGLKITNRATGVTGAVGLLGSQASTSDVWAYLSSESSGAKALIKQVSAPIGSVGGAGAATNQILSSAFRSQSATADTTLWTLCVDVWDVRVPITLTGALTVSGGAISVTGFGVSGDTIQAQASGAYLDVYDTGGTVNSRRFRMKNSSGSFLVIAMNDNGTSKATIIQVDQSGNHTYPEAANIVVGTTTGSKIGTATGQKVAFHNSTPVIQRASSAQTAVATTSATNSAPYGFSTAAQADAIVTLVNELRAALVEKGLIKGSA